MPLFVNCDELGLEQIFSNLISNALDSMEGRPNKRLDIAIRQTDNKVIITLKDSGAGFAPQVIDRIFEPFLLLNAEEWDWGWRSSAKLSEIQAVLSTPVIILKAAR